MQNEIKVILPEKFDLVKGDLFQLFYRGVVDVPNPFAYDILSVCEKGRNYPRYFELLPEDVGEFELKIYVYGPGKVLLGEGTTVLNVTAPISPSRKVNILCIGDSLTAGGEWVAEAHRRLAKSDGEPFGVGMQNINFVGNCKSNGIGYEAFGGWRWDSFYGCAHSSIWVECEHDKAAIDQHSLWSDSRGNLWVLETIDKKRLKFNRAYLHSEPIPENGDTLKYYEYGTNKSPIEIKRCYVEQNSPFINPDTGEASFSWYCNKNNIEGLDFVYILLGANGWQIPYNSGMSTEEYCQWQTDMGKTFVDLIHKDYPKTEIKIMGQIGCSVNGGTGTSYGAKMPYCDDYGYMHYVMLLNQYYEAWTKESKYKDFTEFINISGQIDIEYAMPYEIRRVNSRSTQTEVIGINGAHPSYEGYMQIADAAWRNMVHSVKL